MAKITIEELSGSLKEYLNGLGLTEAQVQELIDKFEDEKIGDISQLSTEEKGSLVGAINELFQSANNGKELIASAIGEPLSSSDTFSAMSNDINGLLSQFKTNMMKNGITIESGDKFKSLIDKIATMVDEGSGKGVQIASGITSNNFSEVQIDGTHFTCLNISLNFKPTILIVRNHGNYGFYIENFYPGNFSIVTVDNGSDEYRNVSNYEIDKGNNNYSIPIGYTIQKDTTYYWAVGVGEEDTTLRDSLASILQEEGVSVTEEDDMASLIGKVDEEFTKDNNTISSMKQELADALVEKGVDVNTENTFDELVDSLINMNVGEVFSGISCRSSLPAEVEDGHIIIITENYNKIYVDNKKIDKMNLSEGDVYIKYGLESPYTENLNNLDSPISIHLEVVYQMINNEIVFVDEIYKGVEGEWVKILDSRVYYFNEGVFKVSSSAFFVNGMSQYNMGLITSGDFNNYFKLDVQTSNGNANGILAYGSDYKIDLTQFSKIKMTYTQKCTATSNYGYALVNEYTPGYFGLFTASEREVFYVGDSRMTCSKFVGHIRTNYDKEFTIEMDVTNIDGEHYFGVGIATQGTTHITFSGMYIKSIEFIK